MAAEEATVGFLHKKTTGHIQRWKRRYCELAAGGRFIKIFHEEHSRRSQQQQQQPPHAETAGLKGVVDLLNVVTVDHADALISISTTDPKTGATTAVELRAADGAEAARWVARVRASAAAGRQMQGQRGRYAGRRSVTGTSLGIAEVEVTLTRSAYGFVPNKRSGNAADLPNEHETGTNKVTSNDRTEPYVGAQTLLRLHGKWGDDWLVELLFEVLLTWNQWAWRERVNEGAAALPLVQLGSDPENLPTYRSPYTGGVGTRGAAILESGMDNSPMYDGAGFDNVTHRVALYDVGMTSLFLAENRALLQLAAVVGRAAEVRALLQPQYDVVAAAMGAHLWDEASGTFANGVVADHGKGSGAAGAPAGAPRATELSPRLSPTAFYPLLAGVPSAAQASAMVERHLTNASEFCVSAACDFAMPSISRADDHFRDNNYWRGRTWGPLNYLVHSALSESAYTQPVEGAAGGGAALATLVNATRARLCRQGLNVLQPQWRAWRHVGENYNSTNAQICDVGNANPYYHWGALLGFTALVETYGY